MMTESSWHPDPVLVERFLKAETEPEQARQLVKHFLSGCTDCRALARSLWSEPELSGHEWELSSTPDIADDVVHRDVGVVHIQAARLAVEQRDREAHLAELYSFPLHEQIRLVESESRFQTWPICEALVQRCYEFGWRDPELAEAYGHLAVAVSNRLEVARYGGQRVADLKARARGRLANAYRILADFSRAEEEVKEALALLSDGTGDPMERAGLLESCISLAANQGDYDRVSDLVSESRALYAELGNAHGLGKVDLYEGFSLYRQYCLDESGALLRKGLSLIQDDLEPRLAPVAKNILLWCRVEAGELENVEAEIEDLRLIYGRAGNKMDLIRLQWLEARTALLREDLSLAETLLCEVRDEFVRRQIGYDSGLVSMDLSFIYAAQGRTREVREMAQSALALFRAANVHENAIAALILLQEAARQDQATMAFVGEVSQYLKRAQSNPALRFETDN